MTLYAGYRLVNVDPDLVKLVTYVGYAADIEVLQGARSLAEEEADIDAGRSHLTNPRDSLHVILPGERDLALAVDIAPYPVDWQYVQPFKDLAVTVKRFAVALGIEVSWGGDWPNPFDFDHYQKGPPPHA